LGRSKGGLSTKIHAACDALGNPISVALGPGQENDIEGTDKVLEPVLARQPRALLADKAYDADARVLDRLSAEGIEAVIPSRKGRLRPRTIDLHLYARRHLIENFFGRLKQQYRAIATRYDKRASIFLSAIHLACCVVWLN
jgi:transposase